MTVTGITEVSKTRCKIEIDQEFAFVLYKGELRNYKITEGKEISDSLIEEVVTTVLCKRAKVRGMLLLKKRPYTEKQMHDKLKQGFYPEGVIEVAIDYFKSFGYIDDYQYATDYIEYYSEGKSRKRLEQDLITKGIDKSLIKSALTKWQEEGGIIDEVAQIRDLLRKKAYDPEHCNIHEKQKVMAFLFRKGFDISIIKKVLNYEEIF